MFLLVLQLMQNISIIFQYPYDLLKITICEIRSYFCLNKRNQRFGIQRQWVFAAKCKLRYIKFWFIHPFPGLFSNIKYRLLSISLSYLRRKYSLFWNDSEWKQELLQTRINYCKPTISYKLWTISYPILYLTHHHS